MSTQLFTCMGPLVSLKMRTLGIDLFASRKLALVDAATLGNSAPWCGRSQAQRRQRSDGSRCRVPARLTAEFGGIGDDTVRCSDAVVVVDQRRDFAIVVGSVPVGCRRLECRDHWGADGFRTWRRGEKLTSWRRLVVMVIDSDRSSVVRAMVVTVGTTTVRTAGTAVVRMNPQRRIQVA